MVLRCTMDDLAKSHLRANGESPLGGERGERLEAKVWVPQDREFGLTRIGPLGAFRGLRGSE